VIITNKYNLPQTLVNLANRDNYSRGKAQISVTELIGSPKIRILKREHQHEMVTDVSDMLWSLLGRAVHSIVEEGADENHIAEERLYATVNGWTLSGGIDLQILVAGKRVALSDYKVTSAWAVMNEKADWERQLNCYAYLIQKSRGLAVDGLTIYAIIRDWSRHEAARRPDYPQIPFALLPQRVWSFEEREAYVLERIRLHQKAESQHDWSEEMPLCTNEERWHRPGKLAVMKDGRVKALKLFEVTERKEAEAYAGEQKARVDERPGEDIRCQTYCPVQQWCSQYKPPA
jgi:hypothetical protein